MSLSPGQRRNKLKSRIALLTAKMSVVRDAESTLAGIQELRNEAARLLGIADDRERRLMEYAASYPDMLKQRRFCREVSRLVRQHPDSDIRVLEYIVSQEQGYAMRFDDMWNWYT